MTKISIVLGVGAALSGCGLVGESSLAGKEGEGSVPAGQQAWEQPVRKASCGLTDHVEPALQGQVPIGVRHTGGTPGYNCNLEMVGNWQGDGAGWQHAWFEDCAYYTTTVREGRANPGSVVIDASKPSNPVPTAYLTETPMLDPWESLKVNNRRALLGADDGADGGGGNLISIYDVAGDCKQPRLLATAPMGETSGHEGNWMQDGNTYWSANGTYNAIDTTDAAKPEFMFSWTPPFGGTHGLVFSEDGTRGVFTMNGLGLHDAAGTNGFAIVDTTDVQNRKPDPEMKVISNVTWQDGSTGQHPILLKIAGKPYVIYVDELGTNFAGANATGSEACARDLPPWGMPRMFDISDEANPKLVAKFMLETNDPANCPLVYPDTQGQVIFSYDSHYCSVDDTENATAMACGFFNSGIRVFDIREPYFPREIAYFNPKAQLDKQTELKGSQHATALSASGGELNADWCSAQVRFRKTADGGGQLWTTCQDNGFMILKFTNGVWPFKD